MWLDVSISYHYDFTAKVGCTRWTESQINSPFLSLLPVMYLVTVMRKKKAIQDPKLNIVAMISLAVFAVLRSVYACDQYATAINKKAICPVLMWLEETQHNLLNVSVIQLLWNVPRSPVQATWDLKLSLAWRETEETAHTTWAAALLGLESNAATFFQDIFK